MTTLANSLKRVPRVSSNPPCFPLREKAWQGAPPTKRSILPLNGLALKSYIDNDNEIMLNTCKDESRNKVIKSSELIEIIEARIEEIFTIINKDITTQNVKQNINTVILAGRGITNINKSDVAGKINLNIPVKMSTGRAVSTVKPEFRTSYALVRYIAARPFAKSVSSKIDSQSNESIFKVIIERIKEFFYS